MRTGWIVMVLGLRATCLAAQAPAQPSWSINAGAGAFLAPTHAGSDEYRVLALPIVQVTFQDRVYLGPVSNGLGGGIGVRLVQTPTVGLAAEMGVMDNRPADRADVLAGTADRDLLGTVSATLTLRSGSLVGTAGIMQGINDGGGLLGTVALAHTRFFGRNLFATLTGTAALADARHMRRNFGVDPDESMRRMALIAAGDARLRPGEGCVYRPGGGLADVGTSLSLTYLLSAHLALTGHGSASRLGDGAAASPLVRQREQFTIGMALTWRP